MKTLTNLSLLVYIENKLKTHPFVLLDYAKKETQ